jgi:hypothetical protein
VPVALDAFLAELADLLDAHAEAGAAPEDDAAEAGNFDCQDCAGCRDCRFCATCRDCERCSHCTGCDACLDSTHCRDSLDLVECSHCDHARACTRCQYVSLCFDCEDCVQCFGCVGLQGAEFHVLNQPVARSEYFETVRRLRRELDERRAAGFRPAYADDPEGWFLPTVPATGVPVRVAATPSAGLSTPAAAGGGGSLTRGQRPPRPGATSRAPGTDGERRPAGSLRAGRRPDRGKAEP